jgi:hypothetical protein
MPLTPAKKVDRAALKRFAEEWRRAKVDSP